MFSWLWDLGLQGLGFAGLEVYRVYRDEGSGFRVVQTRKTPNPKP